MRRRGGKKNSLDASKGVKSSKSGAGNKKRKLTGDRGRYFSKKIHEVEDDDKAKANSSSDSSDEDNSDVELVDKHKNDGSDVNGAGSSDEVSGSDDDGGIKEIGRAKGDGHTTKNNTAKSSDESESDDDDSNDEGNTGNDNESGDSDSGSDEDEEIVETSEDDANNSKTVMPSSKQKKLNTLKKKPNDSSVSKKKVKSIEKVPKFQGTIKASEQNQQTDSPTKKRKRPNEDEIESEISPAKKSCFDDKTESSLEQRREERNSRSLFLKDLPPHTTVEMVKKLVPEVINVRIPLEGNKKVSNIYAFLEFVNEEAAEKNYKSLMEKTIDNKKITVDYCGEKSANYRKTQKDFLVNYKRLFIPSLPMDVTADEIKQHFPDATSFSAKQRGSKRLMFVSFGDEETAKKAFEENEKLTIRGKKITVLLAYKKKSRKVAKNPRRKAKIVPSLFEDEDVLNVSKSDLTESTELTKEKKKKKHKMSKETTKMEIDADEELETSTEKSKVKKKRKNKKVVK